MILVQQAVESKEESAVRKSYSKEIASKAIYEQ